MSKWFKRVYAAFFILLASCYLTFLIDTSTLNSNLQRLFVCGYFLLVCTILVLLRGKYLPRTQGWKARFAAALVLALALTLCARHTVMPTVREATLELHASSGEVWLTGLDVDGVETPLSSLDAPRTKGWQYNADFDDYVFYTIEGEEDNCLAMDVRAGKVTLHFASSAWAGALSAGLAGQPAQDIQLHTEEEEQSDHICELATGYTPAETALSLLGAWTVLTFVLSASLDYLSRRRHSQKQTG